MSINKRQSEPRDWLSKTLAGGVLGLTLALGCSGLFVHFCSDMAISIKAQLAMWMVVPLWLGVFSAVFLFASGRRAWLWLGGANLLIYGALALIRTS